MQTVKARSVCTSIKQNIQRGYNFRGSNFQLFCLSFEKGSTLKGKNLLPFDSAQSDLSLTCRYKKKNFTSLAFQIVLSEDSDQTVQMRMLIWAHLFKANDVVS